MEIRRMDIKDYEAVYQLWSCTKGMGLRSLDDSKDGITRFLKRNPSTNFVAVDGQKIAGVILCGNDGRRGYIYHTAVEPSYRRKGIGKALVDKTLESLKQENIHKVALVVYRSNQTGNAFWEAIGFSLRSDLDYRNISLNSENF